MINFHDLKNKALIIILSTIGLGACNSGTSNNGNNSSNTPQYVYVANFGDDTTQSTVSMYSVNQGNGILVPLTESTVLAQVGPAVVAVNPSGTYAYVTNYNGGSVPGSVSMYSINQSNGILLPLTESSVATQAGPAGIAISPNGSYAYVANSSDNTVSMYSISESGLLAPLAESTAPTGVGPENIAINPTGTFAYVTNNGDGVNPSTVSMYSISESGLLSPLAESTVSAGIGPDGITINSSGTYAYVTTNGESTISMYSITESGLLAPLSIPTVAAQTNPNTIVISPSGIYAYVTNQSANTVSMYSITESGLLNPLSITTVPTQTQPAGIVINQFGFIYVTNAGSNTVSMYSMTESGVLSPLATPTISTQVSPGGIAFN